MAADAQVDVAQVMQFFGSKGERFAAVISVPASVLQRFNALYEGLDEYLGERVVRAFLTAWESIPEESEPSITTLRGAMVNDQARDQLRDFIQARLLAGPRERLGAGAGLRAGVATSRLIGMVVCRPIIGVLVAVEAEELFAPVSPAIQHILVPPRPVGSPSEPRSASALWALRFR